MRNTEAMRVIPIGVETDKYSLASKSYQQYKSRYWYDQNANPTKDAFCMQIPFPPSPKIFGLPAKRFPPPPGPP